MALGRIRRIFPIPHPSKDRYAMSPDWTTLTDMTGGLILKTVPSNALWWYLQMEGRA